MLFKFLEHNGHPITTEGNFIAYRAVRGDFLDKHTGTMNNAVGNVVEVPRSQVDDNPNNVCSHGLHVATLEYAKGFGTSGDRLLDVEVDPSDVVAVPTDYNGTKMRVCKFKVVAESKGLIDKPLVESSYEPEEDEEETNEDSCPNCGAEVSMWDSYCAACGEQL
jgi:ribosomal protein S27AE